MNRMIVVSILGALKKHGKAPVKLLAHEAGTGESVVREWLYALEKSTPPLVTREKRTRPGKSSGRSAFYWSFL